MSDETKTRRDYWTPAMVAKWNAHFGGEEAGKKAPRTHANCMAVFGLARPGKTASDRGGRSA